MKTSRNPSDLSDTRRTTTSQPIWVVDLPRKSNSKVIRSSRWIHPSSRPRPRCFSAINATLHCPTLSCFGCTWRVTSKKLTRCVAANHTSRTICSSTTVRRGSFVISAAMWRLIIATNTISIWRSTSPSSYAANATNLFRKTTSCKAICLRITSASSVRSAMRRSSRLCRWSCISRHDTRTRGVRLVVRILRQIASLSRMCIANTSRPSRFVASFAVSHARRRLKCIFIFCRITLSSSGEV